MVGLILSILLTVATVAHAAGGLSGLQPGEWYQIPGSALSASGVYPPNPVPPGITGPSAIMDAWNGGAFDSKRDKFLIHGGGHGDYGGNEIYSFDLASQKWSRLWGPSSNIPPYVDNGPAAYPDGNPASVHSYSGLIYLPTQDAMWRGGGSVWSGSGGGTHAAWSFGFATNAWKRLADSQSLGVGPCYAYDPVTGHVFGFSDHYILSEHDPAANKWTDKTSISGSVGEEMTCAIDPGARVLVAAGNGSVVVYNLTSHGAKKQTTSGAPSLVSMRGPALTYDSALKKIVGWAGGTSVYALDASTWTWKQYPAAGTNTVTPDTPTRVGVFTRFQYSQLSNLYLLVNCTSCPVFAYRLSAGGTPPPPPPPPPTGSYLFQYSPKADRSSPLTLDKASLSGTVYGKTHHLSTGCCLGTQSVPQDSSKTAVAHSQGRSTHGANVQGRRSCCVELGSRPSPGNDQEDSCLRNHVQGVHGSRLEGGAPILDQERQNGPPGHAQRLGPQEDQ